MLTIAGGIIIAVLALIVGGALLVFLIGGYMDDRRSWNQVILMVIVGVILWLWLR